MSKRKQKIDDPRQMTIDDYIATLNEDTLPEEPENGSCDVAPQLRGILSEIIRESGMSRDEVAEKMTDALALGGEKGITKAQIDSWTREDRDRYIPLEYMSALEKVCESRAITEYFCKLHGGKFIDKYSKDTLDLGQLQLWKGEIAVREREIKQDAKRKLRRGLSR